MLLINILNYSEDIRKIWVTNLGKRDDHALNVIYPWYNVFNRRKTPSSPLSHLIWFSTTSATAQDNSRSLIPHKQ